MALEDIGAFDSQTNPDPYDILFDEDKARKAASAVKIFQDVSVGSSKEKMKYYFLKKSLKKEVPLSALLFFQ